jgi:hypothetical protein
MREEERERCGIWLFNNGSFTNATLFHGQRERERERERERGSERERERERGSERE